MFSRHNSTITNNKKTDQLSKDFLQKQTKNQLQKVQYATLSQIDPQSITNSNIITPQSQNTTTQRTNATSKELKMDEISGGVSISNLNVHLLTAAGSEGDASSSTNSSNLCRFCFSKVTENHSSCQCKNKLCKECLKNELKMTESRENRLMMCTVCKQPYDITYLPPTPKNLPRKIHQSCQFVYKLLFSKQHSHLQGIRTPTSQDVKVLLALFASLAIWSIAATYTLLNPSLVKVVLFVCLFFCFFCN